MCPYRVVVGPTLEGFASDIVQTSTLGWVVGHVVDTTGWDMHPTICDDKKNVCQFMITGPWVSLFFVGEKKTDRGERENNLGEGLLMLVPYP